MLVSLICLDKPGHLELRMKTRPSHLEWIAKNKPPGAVFLGALFAEDGTTMIGSMFVAEFADLDAARAWHHDDPYVKAGLFGDVRIAPSRNLANQL